MSSNPFLYGKAVTGAAFINRTRETRTLDSALRRGQSVILFSPRRYGKTSLIKRVMERLRDHGMLVFYLDLYKVTTLEGFGRYYSETVLSSLHRPADKLFSLVRTLIPSLKPKLTYSEPHMPSIEIEMGFETLRRPSSLVEMLNLPERYCEKKKRRACVVFDEFQELGAFDTDSLLEREMRSAFQHHQLCSYAFLGSKTHLMQELFKDKNRPFYNFGMHVELDTIAESEWISHIDEQFVRTEVPAYSPDYSRHVLRCSKGHPYYTQMLCSELWELLVHGPGHSREPVADALESILEKENHAFVELWDSLSSRERRLCAVLSRCDTAQVFSSDFISLHRLPSPSSMQGVVRRLLRRGVLQRDALGYSLSDPLFRRWCLRREEDGAAGAQPAVEA